MRSRTRFGVARGRSVQTLPRLGKRRYEAAFISKLSDSEAEAAETQTWIQFAVGCEYVPREAAKLFREYDSVLAMLVDMIANAKKWTLK